MNAKRGLLAFVLRDSVIGDCTANGVSKFHDKFILTWEGMPDDCKVFDVSEDSPELILKRRKSFSYGEYVWAEPPQEEGQNLWYMSGGNYLYTTDSRFPNRYPISIHDRHEG